MSGQVSPGTGQTLESVPASHAGPVRQVRWTDPKRTPDIQPCPSIFRGIQAK